MVVDILSRIEYYKLGVILKDWVNEGAPNYLLNYPKYPEEEETEYDQTYEGLFAHLDGWRARVKETEAGIASCQEM